LEGCTQCRNFNGFQRLFEEHRNSRRTIADAIEDLRQACDFNSNDRAEIRIGPLRLSPRDVVGLVDVGFKAPVGDKISIVSLPTSAQFSAIRHGASRRDCFEIIRLNGAVVDADANVLLKEGGILSAVEVIPTLLLNQPTELDLRIVCLTVSMIRAENDCCRSLRAGVPQPQQDMVPDRRFLDCSKLYGLVVPPLKEIAYYIAQNDRALRTLSHQKIADALRKFGMRVPKPRPRVG
jgi:hypothetical protein